MKIMALKSENVSHLDVPKQAVYGDWSLVTCLVGSFYSTTLGILWASSCLRLDIYTYPSTIITSSCIFWLVEELQRAIYSIFIQALSASWWWLWWRWRWWWCWTKQNQKMSCSKWKETLAKPEIISFTSHNCGGGGFNRRRGFFLAKTHLALWQIDPWRAIVQTNSNEWKSSSVYSLSLSFCDASHGTDHSDLRRSGSDYPTLRRSMVWSDRRQ